MTKDKKGNLFKVLIGIALFLFFVGLLLFFTNYSKKVVSEKVVLGYSENSTIDYKVFLIDSDDGINYLEKNKKYSKNTTNNIVATFNYSFLGDKKLDFNYTEKVIALLSIKDNKGNSIYSKEYPLTAENKNSINSVTGFKINKIIDINYKFYSDVVSEQILLRELDEATTISELVVSLNVTNNTNIDEEKIGSITASKLTIPMNKEEFTIDEDVIRNDKKVTAKVSETIKDEEFISISYTLFGIAVLILFITLFYYYVNPDVLSNYKTEYRKVRKAVRKYDELITRTYKMPPIKDKKVYELDRFDNFLAIFEKYDLAITMVEKDTYVTFVMIRKDKAWTYSIDKLDNK